MRTNIKWVRTETAIHLIVLDVQMCACDAKWRTGGAERQRKRDSWEIKTFWRFVDGCIHG